MKQENKIRLDWLDGALLIAVGIYMIKTIFWYNKWDLTAYLIVFCIIMLFRTTKRGKRRKWKLKK